MIGENLAKDFENSEKMNKALMNSPTHRDNIMNEKYKKIGVGCYDNVCVEFFAE